MPFLHQGGKVLITSPPRITPEGRSAVPPVYKPVGGVALPSPSLVLAGSLNTIMDWPSFDAQPNALPLAKNIVERLTRYESNLAGIKRDLDEVNRKVDFLLRQPTTNHGPGFNGPFAPGNVTPLNGSRPPTSSTRHEFPSDVVGPNLILTQTGPLDFEEFNSLGAYPRLVDCSPANNLVPLGVFEEGHPRGLDFNLAALPQTLGDLYTVLSQQSSTDDGGLNPDCGRYSCSRRRYRCQWFSGTACGRIQ